MDEPNEIAYRDAPKMLDLILRGRLPAADALDDARATLAHIASDATHRLAAIDAQVADARRTVVLNGDTYDLLQERAAFGIAWAATAARIPDGYTLSVSSTAGVMSGRFVAATDYGEPRDGHAYADSPTEALQALAAKIR